MTPYEFLPLSRSLQIAIEEGERCFPEPLESAVDAIWLEAKRKAPWLFNGKLLSCSRIEGDTLFGELVDYKYYFAGTVERGLQKSLGINPFGITALTYWKERLLIGRRGREVTLHRGLFETAPTGTIDPKGQREGLIDLKEQYLSELEEETGIDPAAAASITPLYAIRNRAESIVEIVAEIAIESDLPLKLHSPTGEYLSLSWMSREELQRELLLRKGEFVPLSALLIEKLLS